jgi:energy-coupling factor transporter ATP-binding protein EcfA2
MAGGPIVLSVRNLTKTYRSAGEQVAVLRGVISDVAAGESVALTGESGSGKSTLLHLIAGLDRPMAARSAGRTLGSGLIRRRPRGIAARSARAGVSAVQPDPEPERRRQSRVPVAHCRPSRRGLAGELVERLGLGGFAQTLSRAIVRRPAAARRDRPRAGDKSRCCCSPTSRPAISTRRPRTRCWRWRAIWSREPAAAS